MLLEWQRKAPHLELQRKALHLELQRKALHLELQRNALHLELQGICGVNTKRSRLCLVYIVCMIKRRIHRHVFFFFCSFFLSFFL